MIFQQQAGFILDAPKAASGESYKRLLMGERYGKLSHNKHN